MTQLLMLMIGLIGNTNEGLDIRFQPGEVVYLYESRSAVTPHDLFTAVVQNAAIVNQGTEPVVVTKVRFNVYQKGSSMQQLAITQEKMVGSAKKLKAYEAAGILKLYDFQFQTSRYLQGLGLASSDTLQSNEALVLSRESFLFDFVPDSLVMEVEVATNDGRLKRTAKSLRVERYQSVNQHHFPVKGTWLTAGAPSLISHHRWGSIQEFALDLVQIGEGGMPFRGNGSKLSEYYAFGQPVLATEAGRVISVENTLTESDDNLQQPQESEEDYHKRMLQAQQALMMKGMRYAMGNHVIIEHEGGEYSNYFHLRQNSIKVSEGDLVEKGQHIGDLGHSGNSTAPHLHFHITDGPDMLYSRSLPVQFENIRLWPDDDGTINHIHYGQIVITK